MNTKIIDFFQEKALSEHFLRDILNVIRECFSDKILLQEQIYMLCHQYSFQEPEHIFQLIGSDETIVIEQEEEKVLKRQQRELDGFLDESLLGLGGMGEVRRVLDQDLHCHLAMKILHERLMNNEFHVQRFQHEARILAQLQHPNIPPIHRFGYMSDGRPYFVMREVEGRPFSEMLSQFHQDKEFGTDVETLTFRFRRLIDIFRCICSAVGYAHHKGVIHRDLKPSNVMIGSFSEVLVVDWGLSLNFRIHKMKRDSIEGTPSYMSPEQLSAEVLDERSDVFSLGALLYEIITGSPPFIGPDGMSIITKRMAGAQVQKINMVAAPWLDLDIVGICLKALAMEKEERYASAHKCEVEVEGWLDGIKAHERGMHLVRKAAETKEREEMYVEKARGRKIILDDLRTATPTYASQEEKKELWSLEDEVQQLQQESLLQKSLREELLLGALVHKPDMIQAHLGLIDHYIHEHKTAERQRDASSIRLYERRIQKHMSSIPVQHVSSFQNYLKGDAYLELHILQKGVHVHLQKYKEVSRRLVLGEKVSLGLTPLQRIRLEHGSYMLTLSKDGFKTIRYPVFLERSDVWDSRNPQNGDPIRLLKQGFLREEDCYVPGSWFIMGGDSQSASALPRRKCWINSFVVKKYPVTNRDYLFFLNKLVERGDFEFSLDMVPRERSGKAGELGPMIYGYEEDRGYYLCADADGDIWEEEYPVCFIDWKKAHCYAEFLAQKEGLPWRLPREFEWEKSARGVDGRTFPWGFYFEPSWACVREAARGRPIPAVIDTYPIDVSPYGVRGMSGNMCDWTSSIHSKTGPKINEYGMIIDDEIGDEKSYYS
ncbi:MAG: hypothetical protein CL916_07750, partial [Deltaproteobacteria bacterium]|nr:hypothetical protein [Deltaproteobacteria bacterium]